MKAGIILLSCLALAAAVNAARPLDDGFAGRSLLSANLRAFSHPNPSNPYRISTQGCPNAIGFGDYKAFALPQHKILAGKIQFYNHGAKPYRIHDAGFFLHPTRNSFAPVRGELRCPNLFIPANGILDCGFVAPANQPLAFNSFQPFFVPNNVDSPCLCNKPLTVIPFAGGSASSSAQASATAVNGAANSLASALGQAFGSAGYSQAISKANAYRGDALGLAEAICDSVFGPSNAEALSNAEAKGWGNAAADAKAAATSWGSWSDAKGLAIGTAWNGQAAANSDTQAQSYGSGASAANKAVANGKWGATATGSGSATAQGGPAIATSGTAANAGCGAATATNKAGALSTQGAIADGSAQANTGCGPAKAVSSTGAVVTGQGSVGPAVATDKASAAGSTADAKSQAAAVNNGNGPALAESKAEAHGVYEKSASSNAVAQAANGPAVARASSVSG